MGLALGSNPSLASFFENTQHETHNKKHNNMNLKKLATGVRDNDHALEIMAEGNPEALAILKRILEDTWKVCGGMSPSTSIGFILSLDDKEVYGQRICDLYNVACEGRFDYLVTALMAVIGDRIPEQRFKEAIDGEDTLDLEWIQDEIKASLKGFAEDGWESKKLEDSQWSKEEDDKDCDCPKCIAKKTLKSVGILTGIEDAQVIEIRKKFKK